jgi:PPM family protein phosphatase
MLNNENTLCTDVSGVRADTAARDDGSSAAPPTNPLAMRCWSGGLGLSGSSLRNRSATLTKSPCPQRVPLTTPSPAPGRAQFRLDVDDGTSIAVRGRGLIGRDPAAAAGAPIEHLVRLIDDSLTVSRTHLEFGVGEHGLWIRDCGSTNGSEIELNGQRNLIEPGLPVFAPSGCTIHLGMRRVQVRATSGRAIVGHATLDWGVATHTGAARIRNEDEYCTESPVFMVADGMGGHAAGDRASRAVVEALRRLAGRMQVTRDELMACLEDARARLGQIPAQSGPPPGTTLSGVIITHPDGEEPCWMVVNVGDSRTYRLDAGGFTQLTVDHSVAQGLIDAGVVTASAARSVPFANLLTRAVLADIDHQPDLWMLPMRPGDRILVCSDGLSREFDDVSIAYALRSAVDPFSAATDLVDTAVGAGGRDDVTALVIDAVEVS